MDHTGPSSVVAVLAEVAFVDHLAIPAGDLTEVGMGHGTVHCSANLQGQERVNNNPIVRTLHDYLPYNPGRC